MSAYQQLEAIFTKINALEGAQAILSWDNATMMPSGGLESRSEQMATLKTVIHELISTTHVGDLLGEAEQDKQQLDSWQQANLTEMRRIHTHETAIDSHLTAAFSKAGTLCENVWRKARADNDFARLAPYLEEVIHMLQDIAAAKADALGGCTPYEALVDMYDPGTSEADIDHVFNALKGFLPSLIDRAVEHSSRRSIEEFNGSFPVGQQQKLSHLCMETIGFDFTHGRIDMSFHPFCGGVPGDVRITTRYDESDFMTGLMGVNHETGHAMYENHLPLAWRHQPVGKARGMAMHESQSLLVEMQACRSREFLSFLQPHLCRIFGVEGSEWSVDNLYAHNVKVARSLIRVDADEVTYPAHVMLRYDLEKALLSGDLKVKDLPGAWNEKMQEYLGITPHNNKNGCMQDVHWMDGSIGYFPSYTMGAIIAAQLFAAAQKDIPDLMEHIAHGNFSSLMLWLRPRIHAKGSSQSTTEILTEATGSPIDVSVYRNHLENRYLAS